MKEAKSELLDPVRKMTFQFFSVDPKILSLGDGLSLAGLFEKSGQEIFKGLQLLVPAMGKNLS